MTMVQKTNYQNDHSFLFPSLKKFMIFPPACFQAPAMFNKKDNEIMLFPYLEEISDIDEIQETISYKMFLVLFWTDSRIVLRDDITSSEFVPTSLELR